MPKEDFNLFDPHSHKKAKKKASPVSGEENEKNSFPNLTLPQMFERIHDLQDSLKSQIEEIVLHGGGQLEQIRKMISDKSKFSEKEWQELQKYKTLFSSSFGKADEIVKKKTKSEETRKLSHERKSKTLGARRKWIDMR